MRWTIYCLLIFLQKEEDEEEVERGREIEKRLTCVFYVFIIFHRALLTFQQQFTVRGEVFSIGALGNDKECNNTDLVR